MRFNLYLKTTIIYAIAGLICISYLGCLHYQSEVEHVKSKSQLKLLSIVQTAALEFNGDLHEVIHAQKMGVPNLLEEFEQLQHQLLKIAETNGIQSKGSGLYTLRPIIVANKTKFEFVIMDKPDENGNWFIGNTIEPQEHFKEVLSGNACVTEIYADEEGKWISAAAPIKNLNNEVVAILQADMHIDNYLALIKKQFTKIFTNILFVFSFLIVLASLSNAYLLSPLKTITKHIKKLTNVNIDRDIQIKSKDEFEDIANAINYMRDRLSKTLIDADLLVSILNNVNVGVWIVNNQDEVIRSNSHAWKIQGLDMLKKIEQPEITIKDDGTSYLKTSSGETPVIFSKITYQENLTLFSAVDISELAESKDTLQKLLEDQKNINNELKIRQKQLIEQEKMVSIGQLSSGLAHEINNPVGYIGSNIELMEMNIDEYLIDHKDINPNIEKLFFEIKDMIGDCKKGTDKITQIVNGMRSFIYSDKDDEFIETQVSPCIETALLMLEGKIISKMQIKKDIVDDPAIKIQPHRLTEVFLNMFINACQSTDGKGSIHIQVKKFSSYLCITITDTGSGIDEKIQNRIFDPFFTTKGPSNSTGLGLSSAYGIIKDHNGSIELSKSSATGSIFTIKLPL